MIPEHQSCRRTHQEKECRHCCIEKTTEIASHWTSTSKRSSREWRTKRWNDEPHHLVDNSTERDGEWDG